MILHRGHGFKVAPLRSRTTGATAGAGAHARTKARATLLKARWGPQSTMARALEDRRLHQRTQREGVPRELLG